MKKILKIFLWTIGGVVAFVALLITAVVLILTPGQLTPLVEKYANEYLDADVKVENVKLSWWSTFPNITLEVNDLSILTHAFRSLPAEERAKLPAYSDTLLSVSRFRGSINVPSAFIGRIDIRDVMIDNPQANIVVYSPDIASYNIYTSTEPEDTTESSSIFDISLQSVEISKVQALRYFSLPDSMAAEIGIPAAQLIRQEKDLYQLIFNARISAQIADIYSVKDFPVDMNSLIGWNMDRMMAFSIPKCSMHIGGVPISLSMGGDMTDDVRIDSLRTTVGEFVINDLLRYAPEEYSTLPGGLKSNCHGTFSFALLKPYLPLRDELPAFTAALDIPKFFVEGPKGNRIDAISMALDARVDPQDDKGSVMNLKHFTATADAINFALSGKATKLFSDPTFSGRADCNLDIPRLLSVLPLQIPYKVRGRADANLTFDINIGDLSKQLLQNILLRGDLNLHNFAMSSVEDSISIYTRNAKLSINSKEHIQMKKIDKSATIFSTRLAIDTLFADYAGSVITLNDGHAGLGGTGNLARFFDKNYYIPIGGNVNAKRISYADPDSIRMRLTDIRAFASARQFEKGSKKSILSLAMDAHRGSMRTPAMLAMVSDAKIKMKIEPRVSPVQRIIDSLHRAYPKLTPDSLRRMMMSKNTNRSRRRFNSDSLQNRNVENIDMSLEDTLMRGLLRKVNFSGSLQANRSFLRTPYFPLRNSLSNLNMDFSLDSIIVNSAMLRTGRSNMNVEGGIRNIRNTLIGSTRRPLSLDFALKCDTIDVNQLMSAAFAGVNYSEKGDKEAFAESGELTDAEMESEIAADTTMTAFVIPSNISADIDIMAKNVIYSNLFLRDLSGCLQINEGALRIDNFMTRSDVGGLNLNALYAAANKQRIHFAFDLGLKDIELDKFIALIPAVDTILPLLNSMDGVVSADIAASTDIDSAMNVILPSLTAVVKLRGDSLVLFDSETFATISKWLLFKNKKRNLIDNMTVEFIIRDNTLQLFPFIFDIDRYRVGVMGTNDMAFNLKYHISVLKSPIPFKFGLNISGTPEKMKFRLGGAKVKEGKVGLESPAFVENTRINLRQQIENAFRRGTRAAMESHLNVDKKVDTAVLNEVDTISSADSLKMIEQGLIEAPKPIAQPVEKGKKGKRKKK